jgi:hypothetical protein
VVHFACAEDFSWNSHYFVLSCAPVDAAKVDGHLISPGVAQALGDVSPNVDVVFCTLFFQKPDKPCSF